MPVVPRYALPTFVTILSNTMVCPWPRVTDGALTTAVKATAGVLARKPVMLVGETVIVQIK